MWAPLPPSTHHAMAGATVICNLSASNELIGKADYRRQLVTGQSARLLCGYVYANAGYGESTTDVVFAGHNLIAEKGNVSLVTPVPPASVPTIIHPVKAPCPVDDDIQDTEEYVEESLSLDEVKKEMIRKALEKHHGNRKSAAQDLNISERTLYRKIKEYGLD